MAAITRLEDLEIWKLAFDLAQKIYDATEEGTFARDFAMRDQIRRASISSMSNIAEGFARVTNKEFVRFLVIARGSAVEVQSLLHLARSRGYISTTEFQSMYESYGLLCRRIGALIKYLTRAAA